MQNDGYGRCLHCARGQMAFHTEYRPDGYYWQHIHGKAVGPFETRKLACADELAQATKPRRK